MLQATQLHGCVADTELTFSSVGLQGFLSFHGAHSAELNFKQVLCGYSVPF